MADDLPPIVDLRQSATALRVQRGVMRMLRERHDMACYAEVPLSNGRRADVLAVGPKGEIWIVEIKSSLIDFQVDRKWPEYREFSDRFFFAKPPELDAEGMFWANVAPAGGRWGNVNRYAGAVADIDGSDFRGAVFVPVSGQYSFDAIY